MILVILTTVLAVCGAAKLDKSYLPPITAKTAGGSPGALLAPVDGSIGVDGLPSGSYTNDAQGIVVDAALPGTRASGIEPTGLGGPRTSYGSTDSKVGDAAFTGPSTRIAPGFGSITGAEENTGGPSIRIAPGFNSIVVPEGSDYDKTRAGTVKFSNEIGLENYSYGFETDNGISIGENGVAGDGINANGGYSYKGDDGKVYSVSYTADKDGYKPHGSHLPTPPPIPDEILKSLEQNAKEEAAGVVDDGTYDAQKYNEEGDYPSNNGDGDNNRSSVNGADAATGGPFGNQAIKPHLGAHGVDSYKPGSVHGSQGASGFGNQASGNTNNNFSVKDQSTPQIITQHSSSTGTQGEQAVLFNKGQLGQGSGLFTHTTQNRFGVQTGKPSATATASSGNNFNNQGSQSAPGIATFHSHPGFRLPGNGNAAYSSAVTTGSGSASAYASFGAVGPGIRNEYSFGSAGHATASATSQGQGATAQALSTTHPTVGSLNSNKVLTSSHSTLGSSINSQNSNINGLGKNEYLPPVNIVESTGQVPHGLSNQGGPLPHYYGSNAANAPSNINAQPLSLHGSKIPSGTSSIAGNAVGSQQVNQEYKPPHNAFVKPPSHQSNSPGINTASGLSATPTKLPATELTTPFESNSASNSYGGTNNVQFPVPTPTKPSLLSGSQQGSQSGSSFQYHSGQYKPQVAQSSSTSAGTNDANFASNSPKPSLIQQQGVDSSYYYNQPAKPFVTPISAFQAAKFPSSQSFSSTGAGTQFSNTYQQESKYSNTPVVSVTPTAASSQTGQNQGSTILSYYNGITQASISPFPSAAPTPSTQFGSQSSQFGSKPISQIGESSSSQTQFGATENQQTFPHKPATQFTQKPIVQSQSQYSQESSSQTAISQNPSQQGTIYEYNKPTSYKETTSTSEHVTSSINSQTKPNLNSFGSHQQSKPFGSSSQSSVHQSQIQGSTYGSQSASQFVQKPQIGHGTGSISSIQNPSDQTQFGHESSGNSQSGSTFQQTQFGSSIGSQSSKKPTTQSQSNVQQTQFGLSGSQFVQKPTSSHSVSSQSHEQTQGTLYEYNKPTSNEPFNKVPVSASLGSQPSKGSSLSSGTQGQSTQAGKKPFNSAQTTTTFQQSQIAQSSSFGSQPTTQFGQNVLTNQGTGFGSTQTGSKFPHTQFGSSSVSQLGQKPQTTYESSSFIHTTQFGKKPVSNTQAGSTFQQTQSTQGSTYGSQQNTQFGQNSQTKPGTGFGSTQTQTQTTQGSQPTTQFGQKPQTNQGTGFSSSQTSSIPQNTQFGSSFGSQTEQKPLSTQGSSLTSTGQTTQFGNNPVSATQTSSVFQQTQTSQGSIHGSQPTNQFGKRPQTNQGTSFGSSQTGYFQQSQPGTSELHVGHKPQSVGNAQATSPQVKPISQSSQTTLQGTQFGQKPHLTAGSSFASSVASQGQTSNFEHKPSTQTDSSKQPAQFGATFPSRFGQKPSQVSSLTSNTFSQGQSTNVGQTNFGSSQTGLASQQTQFGSTSGSKFGQKPQSTQGTSFTSGTVSNGPLAQSSQFGKKPLSSTSVSGSGFSQAQSSSSSTQGSEEDQDSGAQTQPLFGQKPASTSQLGANVQQTAFGTPSGSQYVQNPQSSFAPGTPSKGQPTHNTQFSQQYFGSSQATGQFGSSTGKNPQTIQGTGLTSGTISQTTTSNGQKPFGNSQQTAFGSSTGSQFGQKPTGSVYQQTQFGSSTNSNFGQKPQSTQSTTFTSTTASKGQTAQTTQFGQKPLTSSQTSGSSFSQTQFSGTSGSQFGQKPQSGVGSISAITPQAQTISQYGNKPFGSQSTQGTFQQTQFGSSSTTNNGQKPQLTQGTTFTSTTASKGQTAQTTQFGQKPLSSSQTTGSSFSQTQFSGTPGSQFPQKPQSGVGSISAITPQVQTISQNGNKPFGSQSTQGAFQQTQFGSSTNSNSGQKPQSTQSTTFTSTTTSKGQTAQTTQFGQKPLSTSQTTGSSFSQIQLSGTSGSQFPRKPQSGVGGVSAITPQVQTISQYGNKPFGSQSTQGAFQQTQFGSSSSSNYGQKPQSTQSTTFTSTTASKGQTAQTTQYGQKPLSSSQTTGSSFSQTQFSGTPGFQFGQKLQSGVGGVSAITPQVQTISQYGNKPFGSQSTQGAYQQTQFGSSSSSNYGQKPQSTQSTTFTSTTTSKGQTAQTTQYGQKPLSSSQTTGSSFSQTQFSGTPGSQFGQKPQSGVGSVSAITPQAQTISQYGNKPFGSQSTQGAFQQTQFGFSSSSNYGQKPQSTQSTTFTSTTASKGQSAQTTQFSQKPLSSTQTTGSSFSQTQFSGTPGSQFPQKQQSGVGSVSAITPQVQTISQYGNKPFGSQSTQGAFQQTQFGSSSSSNFGQKPQSIQGSTFISTTASKGQSAQTTQFSQKPLSSIQTTQYGQKPLSSTQTTGSSFSQTQFSGTPGSQFPQKQQSGVGSVSAITPQVQTISQYGNKPFGSQSSQGVFQQTQFGSSSSSNFGQKPQSIQGSTLTSTTASKGQTAPTTQFGQKPLSSSQTTSSSFSQTQFSGTPGSQLGQNTQSGVGTISAITPQVQSISQYGKKPFGSQSTQGTSQQTQFGITTGSQFAQNIGTQEQTGQTQFGKKPISNSQATGSSLQQTQSTQFGSSSGQKPQNSASAFASSSGSFGSTQTGQISKYQTNTFGTQPQNLLTQTVQQNTQTSSPFGSSQSTQQQPQFTGGQKPFGSQGTTYQIGQKADQNIQPIQSVHSTATVSDSAQSSSASSGSLQSAGYNYLKPQTIFSTASRFGEKPKPVDQNTQSGQTSFTSQSSSAQFNAGSSKPLSTSSTFGSYEQSQSTVASTQFGVHQKNPTELSPVSTQYGVKPFGDSSKPQIIPATQISIEQLQSSIPQFGAQPAPATAVTSKYPSQSSVPYRGQPSKPVFGSAQSSFSAPAGVSSIQDSLNQGSIVSTVQTPISGVVVNKHTESSYVGKGEEFGGPRDPPRYDDKTGYHY